MMNEHALRSLRALIYRLLLIITHLLRRGQAFCTHLAQSAATKITNSYGGSRLAQVRMLPQHVCHKKPVEQTGRPKPECYRSLYVATLFSTDGSATSATSGSSRAGTVGELHQSHEVRKTACNRPRPQCFPSTQPCL